MTGIASAAGCQLAAACDVLVCSRDSTFATPGTKVGLFCTTPSVELLRCVPRKLGLRMLFSAEPVTAAEALAGGLVSEVCADASATRARVDALAGTVAAASPHVMRLGKAAVLSHEELASIGDAYADASAVMVANALEQPDAHEGIAAFLGKRAPVWAADKPRTRRVASTSRPL